MENNQIDFFAGTATFFVNMESSSNGQSYQGMFKVKCVLSPLEYIQSDAMYRELLGKTNPQLASKYVSDLCYSLSQLKYRIIDSPSWFKDSTYNIGGGGVDDAILLHIFEKSIECEEEYRNGIKDRFKKARKEVKELVDKKDEEEKKEQEELEEEIEDDLED